MTTATRVATSEAMLAEARSHLGYREEQGNRTVFAKTAGHLNGQPWCATFLVACARTVGLELPSESAYTPAMANGFQDAGKWGQDARVGAFVFFRWPELGRIAHVGLVEQVLRAPSIGTIEGNTDVAGGRTGGQVMRKLRRANIAGYGYPAYGVLPPPPPPKVYPTIHEGDVGHPAAVNEAKGMLRAWRKARGRSLGPLDGRFDAWLREAVRTFQKTYGLQVDGVLGPQTWAKLAAVTKGATA